MSLLNQNKGKKKGDKKNKQGQAGNQPKPMQKSKPGGFVSKQSNTGSQRGS